MLRLPLSLSMATSPLPKKTQYGTNNLSKGAKSRVRVFAGIQNFPLRVHCVHGIPLHLLERAWGGGGWMQLQRGGGGAHPIGAQVHHAASDVQRTWRPMTGLVPAARMLHATPWHSVGGPQFGQGVDTQRGVTPGASKHSAPAPGVRVRQRDAEGRGSRVAIDVIPGR